MLVGVGPELEWLSGYAAHGNERLNLLIIPAVGEPTYVSPRLEEAAARQTSVLGSDTVAIAAWDEREDPYRLAALLLEEAGDGELLVSDGLRAAFVLALQAELKPVRWTVASRVLAALRSVKDDEEIALLRSAARAADRAMERVIGGRLIGRTEADVAGDVRDRLVEEGHDTAGFWIVASGPNTASPHHEPGDRVISGGEPLLLDIGGRRQGYWSDITRTVWIAATDGTPPDPGFKEIYRLTAAAQDEARRAARPGTTFEALDAVARDVISDGGHGEHFIHRLGHGIGLEVHEEPYLVAGNSDPVRPGNTFSCEPGIYLEGRYGVRIEDAVLCTDDGGESLNDVARELRIVTGS